MRNRSFAAKVSAIALFLTTVIVGPIFASNHNGEFGHDWSQVSNSYSEDVATSDSGAIIYNLSNSNIYRSSNYGTTWANVTNQYRPSDAVTRQMSVSGDGSVIVITEYGGFIWISRNSGASWVKKVNPLGTGGNFYSGSPVGWNYWFEPLISETGQRIMICAGGTILRSSDYGNTFSQSNIPWGWESLASSMSDSGDEILLVLNYGSETQVYFSQDYGVSFSSVSVPAIFPGGVAVSGDGRYLLVSDYIDGGVWVSSDSTASWNQATVTSGNTFDFLGPQFTISNDGSRIVQTNYRGSILVSNDFGATFIERNIVSPEIGMWGKVKMNSDGSIIYMASDSGVYKSVMTNQSSGLSNSGTVTFNNVCPADTSTVTSVQAQSVLLILDTATIAFDTNDYHYYTETNTALWGATYDYGSTQAVDCSYSDMTGSMTLARGPFIATSGAAYSETSTVGQNAEFVQYIGNLNETGNVWSHTNNCGNTTVANLNVANACNFEMISRQGIWPRIDTGVAKVVRSSGVRSGLSLSKTASGQTTSQDAATIFVVVKAKKTVIAAAPANTSWVATETFTVTSA